MSRHRRMDPGPRRVGGEREEGMVAGEFNVRAKSGRKRKGFYSGGKER